MQSTTQPGNSTHGPANSARDPERVAAYFSRRLGVPVVVTGIRPTFPGLSRETLIISAEIGGESQLFALRLDFPWGGACPFSLEQEWGVYWRLWKSPVPVPEPLWFDQGIEFAEGRPHMVRRLVDGVTLPIGLADPGSDGARSRQRIALECAEKLALVHTLDWKAYGFDTIMPAPTSVKHALGEELALWRRLWETRRTSPHPVIEEAMCWLAETMPAETARISLCKGNNGVGEEIWRGQKIVALCDWEFASLNDGVLDLAFSQGTLTLGDFGQTLRHYEKCSGGAVSPVRLAAAMFITWFKSVVGVNLYMGRNYVDGIDKRITNLSFGLIIGKATERRLAACIGKDLVTAWESIAAPEQSSYFRLAS